MPLSVASPPRAGGGGGAVDARPLPAGATAGGEDGVGDSASLGRRCRRRRPRRRQRRLQQRRRPSPPRPHATPLRVANTPRARGGGGAVDARPLPAGAAAGGEDGVGSGGGGDAGNGDGGGASRRRLTSRGCAVARPLCDGGGGGAVDTRPLPADAVAVGLEGGVGDGGSTDGCKGDGGGRRRHDAADGGAGRRYATDGHGVCGRVARRVATALAVGGASSKPSCGRTASSHHRKVGFYRDGKRTTSPPRLMGPPPTPKLPTARAAPHRLFPPRLCAPLPPLRGGPVLAEARPT